MISVDRDRIPPPQQLLVAAKAELGQLRKFFSSKTTARRQSVAPFNRDVYGSIHARAALYTLFGGRCAFCESKLTEFAEVTHYRPMSRASQESEVSAEHYWWLAYEWHNLYLTCGTCYKFKGTKFPVTQSRASAEARGADLLAEGPLLVDPCSVDVSRHFSFLSNGKVEGRTTEGGITIDVFGLNRQPLVRARAAHVRKIRRHVSRMVAGATRAWSKADLKGAFTPAPKLFAPYLALSLQETQRALAAKGRWSAAAVPDGATPAVSHKPLQPATGWLRRVEIENFRALQDVELEFPVVSQTWWQTNLDSDDQEPWIVLLGNNGVGKSSLLKAIALALLNPAERRRLYPDARTLLTRERGQTKGRIRLWFTDQDEPLELTFGQSGREFRMTGTVSSRLPVLAYGSTRLLPSPGNRRVSAVRRRSTLERTGNLFSAGYTLSDAERWLADAGQVGKSDFDLISSDLKTLLALQDREHLSRRAGALSARLFRKQLAVRELSDGFQSVLALTLDMMRTFSQTSHDMHSVEGLVLLDEIEVHLHPTWKTRVVHDLRKMFRRTRFIVTTHDPLCVQGLAPGELHVMTRNEKSKRVEVNQVDVPLGLRADQILTGEWFGLGSTRDPDTLKLMRRHSELLLRRALTPDQRIERSAIEATLRGRLGRFADSAYELAGLQAYAELAPRLHDVPLEVQRERLRTRIRQLLPHASLRKPA